MSKKRSTPPLEHPRLTWSDYEDWQAGNVTAAEWISASHYKEAFLTVLQAVLDHSSQWETVDVHWWHETYIYIQVKDTRWHHYPCWMRFLISFDTSNGLVASSESKKRYAFARKRWGPFADRLVGYRVARYKDCGQPEKETFC